MRSSFHVVFCGTPSFAVPTLTALAKDPTFTVDLVITQPDRPKGRRHILTPPPVKVAAEKLGLPVWQPENINRDLQPRPDFLVVVAYGQILSKDTLAIPTIAPINLHASLLPRWRGASPIEHAILAGDEETGVTIQSMVKGLDAGPILAQERLPLGPEDITEDLRQRLAELGARLLVQTLKASLCPVPQPPTGITVCHKFTHDTGNIEPKNMLAVDVDRHVRALGTEPGIHCLINGFPLRILRTTLHPSRGAIPLPCKGGTMVYLAEVQPPGKKDMTGEAWLHGHQRT